MKQAPKKSQNLLEKIMSQNSSSDFFPQDRSASLAQKLPLQEMCTFLTEKKAKDILLIDLKKANPYFDLFLLASVSSTIHLRALANEFCKKFHPFFPKGMRGYSTDDSESGWVVLDMIDMVVHLFMEEQREFYKLERLWGDANFIYPSAQDKKQENEARS